MANYQLVRLANGAFSVRSLAENETFHPVIGPAAEAEALYVNQLKLRSRLQSHAGEFVIWDVGLGAAANVLAVLRASADLPCSLRVISFDRTLEPLRFALQHTEELGYFGGYENAAAELIQTGRASFAGGRWEFRPGDFPAMMRDTSQVLPPPHAILFDAFSPARNPAMWTAQLFFRCVPASRPASALRDANLLAQHDVACDAVAGGILCGGRAFNRRERGNHHRGQCPRIAR